MQDGGMGKLADDLRFAPELLPLTLAEAIHKSLDGDDAADDVVAGLFNATRGTGTEVSESLVAVLLQGNHQAERSRRAARSRKPLPLLCGGGTTIVLRRASGKSSSARASAGA